MFDVSGTIYHILNQVNMNRFLKKWAQNDLSCRRALKPQ